MIQRQSPLLGCRRKKTALEKAVVLMMMQGTMDPEAAIETVEPVADCFGTGEIRTDKEPLQKRSDAGRWDPSLLCVLM